MTTRSAGAVVSALESQSPEKLVHVRVTFTTGPCRSFNVAIQHHNSLTSTADPPSSFLYPDPSCLSSLFKGLFKVEAESAPCVSDSDRWNRSKTRFYREG